MSSQSDSKAQDAFGALAAGAQTGGDIESAAAHSEVMAEAGEFADLIGALTSAFEPVEPAVKFADELRADLLGEPQGLLERLRKMPARVHIAAALALIAGCLLFVMRRLFGSDAPQDIQEEAVATPL